MNGDATAAEWRETVSDAIGATMDPLFLLIPDDGDAMAGLLEGVTLGMLNAWFDGTDAANGDLAAMRDRLNETIDGLWLRAVAEACRDGELVT